MDIKKDIHLNKNRILWVYVFGVIIFFFYLSMIFSLEMIHYQGMGLFVFVTIGLVSFFMMLKEMLKYAYSLVMMHWFFFLMFYGIAAFLQYLSGNILYFSTVSNQILLTVSLIFLGWIIFFTLGTKTRLTIKPSNYFVSLVTVTLKPNSKFIIMLTCITVLITFYLVSSVGFLSMFSRSTSSEVFEQGSLAESSILQSTMRNIILYGLAISIAFLKSSKKGLSLVIIQLLCFLVINFPTGVGRSYVAIAYIGLLLLLFPSVKKKSVFMFIFFFAFIVVFPMINVFRNYSLDSVTWSMLYETIQNISQNYLYGDYDAFAMIIYTVKYVSEFGLTYGYQLLGPLLFFVPRIFWESKPVGSGYMILETYGHGFKNGSEPLIAEGLLNFGILGVLVFAFIAGNLAKSIDKCYWKFNNNLSPTFISIFYPFFLSIFFFMLRGDLMNTFAFFMSHLVIFSLLFFLNNRFMVRVNNKKMQIRGE